MTFIVSGALPGMGSLNLLGKELGSAAMVAAADAATNTFAYRINRARLASLIHLGYSGLDTYEAMRPGLFLASLAAALASGYGLAKRRKKSPETGILYGITLAASIGSAWVTRPSWLLAPPPATTQVDPNAPGIVRQTIGALDRRVQRLSQREPGWEGRTLVRLWGDLGSGTIPPVAATLLTKHAQ
jgi:hypothetical protein